MAKMGFWVHAKRVGDNSFGNMFLAFSSRRNAIHSMYSAPFVPFRNFFGVPLRGASHNVHCWSRHAFEVDDYFATASLEDPRLSVWFKVLGRSEVELSFDLRAGHGPQWGRVRRTVPVFTYKPQEPGQRNYFDYLGPLGNVYLYVINRDGGYTEQIPDWLGRQYAEGWIWALAGDNLCTRDMIDTLIRNTMFEEW